MSLGELAFPSEDRAKQEMLDNGQFSQDLCEVHLHHPLVHFVPGLYLRAKPSRDKLTWVTQRLTADISSSMGLCHRNEAVFTYQEMSRGDEESHTARLTELMNLMHARYI